MKTSKELLLELMELIYNLQKSTPHDWHLSFSGHVKSVSVYYYKNGYHSIKYECCQQGEPEAVWISYEVHYDNLKRMADLIKKVQAEVERLEGEK